MDDVFVTLLESLFGFFYTLFFFIFGGKSRLREGRNCPAYFLPKILFLLSEAMSFLVSSGNYGSSLHGQKRKTDIKQSSVACFLFCLLM